MLDCFNNYIVEHIVKWLNTESLCGSESCQKVKYALKVMIDEIEKIIILFIVYGLLGMSKEYMIIMITMGSLRMFLGGSHRKTSIGCLIFSFTTVFTIILLARNWLITYEYMEGLILLLGIIIIKIAPIVSKKRGIYSYEQNLKFKTKALFVLLIISRVIGYVSSDIRNIMLCSLTFQAVEVIIVKTKEILMKGGTVYGE